MIANILKPHTHAGVDYPAGSEIEVSALEAEWLAAQKIIDQPKAKTGKAAAKSEKGNKS